MRRKNWAHGSLWTCGVFLFLSACGKTGGGSGKIYILDGASNALLEMTDLTGKDVKTFKGVNATTFSNPTGLAFDGRGRFYVCDSSNGTFYRFDDMTGKNFIGFQSTGTQLLTSPTGIAVDTRDRIYVADGFRDRLVRMDDVSGTNFTTFGTSGSGNNQFVSPGGITLDSQTRIYVADRGNHRVVRIDDMVGTGFDVFKPADTLLAQAVALDRSGYLYVAAFTGGIVQVKDLAGTNRVNLTSATQSLVGNPSSVSVGGGGVIYMSNSSAVVSVADMTGKSAKSTATGNDTVKNIYPLAVVVH